MLAQNNIISNLSASRQFSSNNFLIFHQNIRSIRKNFDLFIAYLRTLTTLPAIICLSEIWIYDYEATRYHIPGYEFLACCNNNYRSGGVGIFYNVSLICSYDLINIPSADVIKLNFKLENESYSVVCVYRLQNSVSVSTFISEFSNVLSRVKSKNLIVLGDMNIDILNLPTSSDDYISMMSSFGLNSLINSPSRVVNASATCIDHCFARLRNNHPNNIKVSSCALSITDHYLIKVELASHKMVKHSVPITNIIKFDFAKFREDIIGYNFLSLSVAGDPSQKLSELTDILYNISNTCRSLVTSKPYTKLKPWISRELIGLINRKNYISKKYHKHPNNAKLKKYLSELSSKVDSQIKLRKFNYYNNKLNSCQGDIKKTWGIINDILCNKGHIPIDKICSANGEVISEPVAIANEFASYFDNIVNELRSSVAPRSNFTDSIDNGSVADSFFIAPVDGEEIKCIIDSLKPSNRIDSTGISSALLKNVSDIVSPIISVIINESFAAGIVPDFLKSSEIIPVHKKGDRLLVDNFRPIALQPNLLKIIEKTMKTRVDAFLKRSNYLSNNQYGFRAGRSTESALIKFLNNIHQQLNNKLEAGSIFIDIKRAFDMVDHGILLKKLDLIGFRGLSQKWFSSYLSDRSYRVRIGESFSDPFSSVCGVPQGSVLGPLLFLVYINDMFRLQLHGNIIAFADDMALSYSGPDLSSVSFEINQDLIKLRSWFDDHCMVLSEKTKIMFFKYNIAPLSNTLPLFYYHSAECDLSQCPADCMNIQVVSDFRYLGIILDSNLNWKLHSEYLKSQLNSALRAFYLLRPYCPLPILLGFYHACVGSRLNYGLPCWGGAPISTLIPLLSLQNHIIRVIGSLRRRVSCWAFYVANKILPLQHLYIFRVLRMFYLRSGQKLVRLVSARNCRINNDFKFVIPSFRTEAFRRYCFISGPYLANKLPMHIRKSFYSNTFLPLLKNFLFENKNVSFMFQMMT